MVTAKVSVSKARLCRRRYWTAACLTAYTQNQLVDHRGNSSPQFAPPMLLQIWPHYWPMGWIDLLKILLTRACARLPKGTNCHLDVGGDLLNGCRRRLCKIVRPKLEPDCQSLEIKNEHCRPKKRSSCFINVQTFLNQSCGCIGWLKESLFAVHSPSANFAQGLQSSSLLVNFSQSETKSCPAPVLPSSATSRSAQS